MLEGLVLRWRFLRSSRANPAWQRDAGCRVPPRAAPCVSRPSPRLGLCPPSRWPQALSVGPSILHPMAIPPFDPASITPASPTAAGCPGPRAAGLDCLQAWTSPNAQPPSPSEGVSPSLSSTALCPAGGSRANPLERAPHLLRAPSPPQGQPRSPSRWDSFGGGTPVPQP